MKQSWATQPTYVRKKLHCLYNMVYWHKRTKGKDSEAYKRALLNLEEFKQAIRFGTPLLRCKKVRVYIDWSKEIRLDCCCIRRPITDLDEEVILDLRRMGWSFVQIGDFLNRDAEHLEQVMGGDKIDNRSQGYRELAETQSCL